jgi:hypothetical protein
VLLEAVELRADGLVVGVGNYCFGGGGGGHFFVGVNSYCFGGGAGARWPFLFFNLVAKRGWGGGRAVFVGTQDFGGSRERAPLEDEERSFWAAWLEWPARCMRANVLRSSQPVSSLRRSWELVEDYRVLLQFCGSQGE